MARFTELEIQLSRLGEERYQVDFEYHTPMGELDIQPLRQGPADVSLDFKGLSALSLDAEAYGRLLSRDFFAAAEVESAFKEVLASARSLSAPLRVKLVIQPNAVELHDLHWETLRSPHDDTPLTTSENLLFSRLLRSPEFEEIVLPPKSDLRALAVVANPAGLGDYGLEPVDTEKELSRLAHLMGTMEWAAIPGMREHPRASLDDIAAALRSRSYQILYLVCHGKIIRGEPYLWLEDERGQVARISAEVFSQRLRELQERPLLAVLVSCESAGAEEGKAISALGPRLVQAGVTVVLAMQGSVSVPTMERYIPAFFQELLRDGQVDRAAAVARGAVRERSDHWMPVLFSRLRGGCLFRQPEVSAEQLGQRVGEGISALVDAMREPKVRQAAIEYQLVFREASEHIGVISYYKQLHEEFQKLEIDYNTVKDNFKLIFEDEDAWFEVKLHAQSAGDKIDELLAIAGNIPVLVDPPLWLETMPGIKTSLLKASNEKDPIQLQDAVNALRRLLNREITRSNDSLVAFAKTLRLGAIVQAMSTIRDTIRRTGLELQVAVTIDQGVEDLSELGERLATLVKTHDTWQAVDDQLRLAEATISSDPLEFQQEIWPQVKSLGHSLYGEQSTDWAVALQEQTVELEESLSGDSTRRIGTQFHRFRTLGSQRFRKVDKELLALCAQLQQIGTHLNMLIRIFDE